MQKLKEFFEKQDRFAKLLGFEIEQMQEGNAVVSATIKQEHLNGADVVHGGFLFSMADYAFAIASNSKNNLSLAINANILFQKAKSGGKLFAKAKELSDGKKVATYEVRISDEEDNTIATFTGTVYRKGVSVV